MPALPCANHPKELTYVKCGRCDTPICVNCMVDTPVGKKCRACARSRTHLSESTPGQLLTGFVGALLVAIPAGFVLHHTPIAILSFVYGALVGEVAVRAGRRSRSLALQCAAALAAAIGGLLGAAVFLPPPTMAEMGMRPGLHWSTAVSAYPLVLTGIGAAVAFTRVRFL
jgi:hypothetical protein